KILVQGLTKAVIDEYVQLTPTYLVKLTKMKEPPIPEISLETEALMRAVKEQVGKIISMGKILSPDVILILDSINDPGRLADLVASNLGLKIEESQQILEIVDPLERLNKVNEFLNREVQLLTMQVKIQSQAREEMTKTQREYYLREQLRAIQSELGEIDEKAEEITDLKEKIKAAKMPEEVEKESNKQLKRLEQMHPDSAESGVIRTYIEWLAELPWSVSTQDNLDLKAAQAVLDEDHYDLEKVKERIVEYLGVRKLKEKMKGPILCFVGPPGVGKTSLGKSIARALGRKFIRVSLGGMRDEAEIRGHRRTYVGALPGRIIQGIKQAGTNNPIFMMDEIDKVGTDWRGDPSSALLEVLDPEQNVAFSDHYLNLPFDLSNVMFITTANVLDPIPPALRDRMEVISLSGYTEEEKVKIAKKYLIPRQVEENGLKAENIDITDEGLRMIISHYTREAGLRNLEREIAGVCRKVARKIAEGQKSVTKVTAANIHRFLGVPKILPEAEQEKSEVGVATGLAWTEAGGEILYIETSILKGKGNLILTGHLGDVMKESAQAALSYARSKAGEFNIPEDFYEKNDIHIHVPAGAIPKDGPSAGVTMATSLISALTKIPVSKDVAMTGEITLIGRVLPIGGLKEKALAALMAGIKTIIIPSRNKKDLEDIPKELRKKITFIFADHIDDVLKVALLKQKEVKKKEVKKKEVKKKEVKKKEVKKKPNRRPVKTVGRRARAINVVSLESRKPQGETIC
ncbi:MAG: ATP-dependent proteinase, Serine peptidase, MEROPS family S16, partial [Deltaproteobacteria bacterium]|nr:ATP-dependent proteinase, Serine peptidase, MEROPS family S16 [Deltaproteobacteria bacterium]